MNSEQVRGLEHEHDCPETGLDNVYPTNNLLVREQPDEDM